MKTLNELALQYGTDKASNSHNYVKLYEQYFSSKRLAPVSILELGWGGHEDPEEGGRSAQMWRDFFNNGTVVCIDIEEKVVTDAHDGLHFRQGSQADRKFLNGLAEEFGPFDFIVDDASHLSSLTIASWQLLYPHLKPGGIYAVEDTHMAYHDFWYGKEEANENPRKARANGQPTAMQYFQHMTDDVNFLGRGRSERDLFPRAYWQGYSLEWVHFYFNILFARKRVDV